MDHNIYLPLLIIFAIAWTVPVVLSWLEVGKVPAVIVEIIAGVIVGPYALNWVNSEPLVDFLAETGFLFLIFLAGLEMDVNKIINSLPNRRIHATDFVSNSFLMATGIYVGALILAMPFSIMLHESMGLDFVFGTILLPTAAIGIIVPILKAEGTMNLKFGQTLLMEGAIATIMSVILISIYSGVLKNGFQVELLLFGIIFLVFIVTYFVGKKLLKGRTFQILLYRLEHAASQIKVRGAVALFLLFIVIAYLIDTELIMGAFFAGTLLSLFVNKERSALMFKLDGMSYGFFIPIFFIMVGVNLDLSALSQFGESIPFILLLTGGFFLIQLIPSLLMAPLFGFKKSMAGGMLLTARLGETVATAQIGLTLGIISAAENAGIVTASILTSVIAPLVYNILNPEFEHRPHHYILGGSRSSFLLAERLNMHGISCLTVIQNQEIKSEFERKSIPVKLVEDLKEFTSKRLQLRTSDVVVVLTESRLLTLDLARIVKNDLNHGKIIMRMQAAAHDMIDPNQDLKLIDHDEVLANHVENMIVRPNSISSVSESFGLYTVEEIRITKKSLHRKLVKEIAFPPSGSLVIQKRGSEIFIPHGDTHLLLGDLMTVIGNSQALEEFRNIFED
jgi:Kef-type K+ transport system membrane component KefB/Trk K+ transport system NAD-binding subunit